MLVRCCDCEFRDGANDEEAQDEGVLARHVAVLPPCRSVLRVFMSTCDVAVHIKKSICRPNLNGASSRPSLTTLAKMNAWPPPPLGCRSNPAFKLPEPALACSKSVPGRVSDLEAGF